MEEKKMVRQANQIAKYFSAYPQARAEEGVLGHITKFWEPRMRAQLIDYAKAGGEDLHPLVAKAAAELQHRPAAAERASGPTALRE